CQRGTFICRGSLYFHLQQPESGASCTPEGGNALSAHATASCLSPALVFKTSPTTRGLKYYLNSATQRSRSLSEKAGLGELPWFLALASSEEIFLCAGGTGSRMQGKRLVMLRFPR
ncbi:hypothetical protein Y956_09237, partial [Nipponia nippon]